LALIEYVARAESSFRAWRRRFSLAGCAEESAFDFSPVAEIPFALFHPREAFDLAAGPGPKSTTTHKNERQPAIVRGRCCCSNVKMSP